MTSLEEHFSPCTQACLLWFTFRYIFLVTFSSIPTGILFMCYLAAHFSDKVGRVKRDEASWLTPKGSDKTSISNEMAWEQAEILGGSFRISWFGTDLMNPDTGNWCMSRWNYTNTLQFQSSSHSVACKFCFNVFQCVFVVCVPLCPDPI